jgi:4-hydroxy-tetrahydrodipicolinate synthase
MKSPAEIRAGLRGPIGSLRTPFTRDGAIDFTALRRMVDFLIDAGSPAVMLTYGDSLYSVLTDREVEEVTQTVAEQTAGRALVIAADRGWWTGKALEFADYAREVGADLLMLMPPTWTDSATPETLATHYAVVSARIPVMVVTNVFSSLGTTAGLETLRLTLERAPNVVAVKDDLCDEFGRRLSMAVSERMAVVAGGQKQNHLNAWLYGCDGYLSTFVTFKPAVAHAYWNAVQHGDSAQASKIVRETDMPFFDTILKLPGGFDAGMHGVLELFGLAERWRRPPYASLNDAEMEKLSDFLRAIHVM